MAFVFCYDTLILIYYIYHLPLWDRVKQRFVYYQYRVQSRGSTFSNFLLTLLFQAFTKGLCLALVLFFYWKASAGVDDVIDEHKVTKQDLEQYKNLEAEHERGQWLLINLMIHIGLMFVSIIVQYLTYTEPLREYSAINQEVRTVSKLRPARV